MLVDRTPARKELERKVQDDVEPEKPTRDNAREDGGAPREEDFEEAQPLGVLLRVVGDRHDVRGPVF